MCVRNMIWCVGLRSDAGVKTARIYITPVREAHHTNSRAERREAEDIVGMRAVTACHARYFVRLCWPRVLYC